MEEQWLGQPGLQEWWQGWWTTSRAYTGRQSHPCKASLIQKGHLRHKTKYENVTSNCLGCVLEVLFNNVMQINQIFWFFCASVSVVLQKEYIGIGSSKKFLKGTSFCFFVYLCCWPLAQLFSKKFLIRFTTFKIPNYSIRRFISRNKLAKRKSN